MHASANFFDVAVSGHERPKGGSAYWSTPASSTKNKNTRHSCFTCKLAWRLLHAGPQIVEVQYRLPAKEGFAAFGMTRNAIDM